ncbi:ribosome silencing factor [Massilia sp. W12]|uniref:ribosome silencing factor n=1 Tax=Massilia sp. W12 TaxID=3126507 RepID=UPI0030CE5107
MEINKLQALVIDALEDVKAQDIRLFDTTHLSSLFERIVIATGTSNRQTRALAASVRDKVKEAGGSVVGLEGEDTGEWVLVDLNDMLVHIMQAPIRAYYRLEEIWGDKPISIDEAKRAAKRKNAPKSTKTAEPVKTSKHLAAMQDAPEESAPKRRSTRKTAEDADAAPAKPRARKSAAGAEAPAAPKTRARKTAVSAVSEQVQQVVAAKKPRSRKSTVSDEAVESAAPAPKVARGAKVKVAQSKSVTAELKEVKAAKTAARKATEKAAEKPAAPAKRVIRRVKSGE